MKVYQFNNFYLIIESTEKTVNEQYCFTCNFYQFLKDPKNIL